MIAYNVTYTGHLASEVRSLKCLGANPGAGADLGGVPRKTCSGEQDLA